jgi:hypothetical protein
MGQGSSYLFIGLNKNVITCGSERLIRFPHNGILVVNRRKYSRYKNNGDSKIDRS